MSNLIIKEFQGSQVRFEMRDGRLWGCLTDMAEATGKRVNNYLRLEGTKELVKALQNDVNNGSARIRADPPIMVNESFGSNENRGTWGIEEIVIDFAYWCNMRFRLWVLSVTRDVLKTGGYIAPEATPAQLEAITIEWFRENRPEEFKTFVENLLKATAQDISYTAVHLLLENKSRLKTFLVLALNMYPGIVEGLDLNNPAAKEFLMLAENLGLEQAQKRLGYFEPTPMAPIENIPPGIILGNFS